MNSPSADGRGNITVIAYATFYTSKNMVRFVQGIAEGVDDPIVWFGGGENRQLHADHQGSIVAVTNGSGAATWTNAYDDGASPVPATWADSNIPARSGSATSASMSGTVNPFGFFYQFKLAFSLLMRERTGAPQYRNGRSGVDIPKRA